MKKTAAFVMAVLMLFLTMFGVHAEETPYQKENGFSFRIEASPDGDVLCDVTHYSLDKTVYVPKTLGGIALTPDVLDGTAFYHYYWKRIAKFTVDEDNPWFIVRDDALYSKDGKTAVVFPNALLNGIYIVPDGTQTIASHSLFNPRQCCIVLPDSVTTIADDAVDLSENYSFHVQIAASPGGAAEAYAARQQYPFIPMGETHTHVYFLAQLPPTCTSSGYITAQCPCGEIYSTEVLPPDPDAHNWRFLEDADGGNYVCVNCGAKRSYEPVSPQPGCSCLCHQVVSPLEALFSTGKTGIRTLIYCVVLFFWRLTGTHQYCACGVRHY